MSAPPYRVTSSVERFSGSVFDVLSDTVRMADGSTAVRDYVRHLGVVAVVPIDDRGRVVMVRQYRHPIGESLWELPAGLLDVHGEHAETAAKRELAEEAGLVAGHIEPLFQTLTSPGYSDERVRIYLARNLSPVGSDFAFHRVFEEAHLTVHAIPFAEALSMLDRGEIVNAICAIGLLMASRRVHG